FVALMRAIRFEEENIHALFDAFGPDAEDRNTVVVWAAGIADFYAPDLAGVPGYRLVGARAGRTGPAPESGDAGCAHPPRGGPGWPGAAPNGTARRPTRLQPSRPRAGPGRVLHGPAPADSSVGPGVGAGPGPALGALGALGAWRPLRWRCGRQGRGLCANTQRLPSNASFGSGRGPRPCRRVKSKGVWVEVDQPLPARVPAESGRGSVSNRCSRSMPVCSRVAV